MKRGVLQISVGLGATACVALWLWWPRLPPAPTLDREGAPPVEVTLPMPPPLPAPSEPPPAPAPAEPAAARPAPAEPVAALPQSPGVDPVTPPPADRLTIARAQFLLEQLGYPVGVADGVAGKRTKAAVTAFRASHGLSRGEAVDGALIGALELATRQLAASRRSDGVPVAAPRIPVVSAPLSEASR